MNTAILNTSQLNHSVLNASILNATGMVGRGNGGAVAPDEYVLNNAVLLKNGKPLLLTNGTPLVLLPKSDEPELDASLVDAWIFSGYRNEDAPASIAGVNGIELTCHNFAWNEEGSGFKDGALWFDGVDDLLEGLNIDGIENDCTVILKYAQTAANEWSSVLYLFDNNNRGIAISYHESHFVTEKGHPLSSSFVSHEETAFYSSFYDLKTSPTTDYINKNGYNGEPFTEAENISYTAGNLRHLKIGTSWGNQGFATMQAYYCAIYNKLLSKSEVESEIANLEAMWNKRLNNN